MKEEEENEKQREEEILVEGGSKYGVRTNRAGGGDEDKWRERN